MRVLRDTDLTGYATAVLPFLLRDPVVNNVPVGLIDSRRSGQVPVEPDGHWLRVESGEPGSGGGVCGVALRTPPYGMLLTPMPPDAVAALADHLAADPGHADLPEVDGAAEVVEAFADRFARLTGARVVAGSSQRIYRLDVVTPPAGVPGELVPATAADELLLAGWVTGFAHDPGGAIGGDAAAALRRRIATGGQVFCWRVDGRPVAMDWVNEPVAGVVRVSGVYTPPELRGRGYASALVAATSQVALDAGATACMLYTDLANPISNKIYQRVGYRPVRDTRSLVFIRP
jgi:predicted GNAT family acetyltransferase